nr:hypothetical protein [Desulfitobacterium hafniense]
MNDNHIKETTLCIANHPLEIIPPVVSSCQLFVFIFGNNDIVFFLSMFPPGAELRYRGFFTLVI